MVRKRAGIRVPGKRKGASQEACAKLDLYFQTSRFEGVNPPNFSDLFLPLNQRVGGNWVPQGLDRFSAVAGRAEEAENIEPQRLKPNPFFRTYGMPEGRP
jgi:hypothetical protein